MNPDIKSLHQRLGRTVGRLSQRLGRTTDPEEARAILREMQEVNFRVTMAGGLLFSETTAAIDKRIRDVVAAADDVDEEIRALEKVRDVVRTVSRFLGLVDKALDAAKVVA